MTEKAPVEEAAGQASDLRQASRRDRTPLVLQQQRILRRILETYGAEPYGAVDTVANALLVRLPDNLAERIESIAGVRRVYPVQEVRAWLERAMPLHHVPEAWARIGGSSVAGSGVKIAIIDSGIDVTHPGFVDPSTPMPEGFPRANRESDLAFTSNKVIVARSYMSLLNSGDISARDENGHGTAVAMAAGGVLVETANGPVSGAATKAWLGSYRVFPGNGTTRTDIVLKAIDDAVRDGMNVINLSLGSALAARPADEILTRIVDRLASVGILVVVSAGNEGPGPFSLGDTSVPGSALAVGATWNDRTYIGLVTLAGGPTYQAELSDATQPNFPITAPMFDVSQLDPTGLACSPFPSGSLSGRIAFILRGDCFFRDKLNNAEAAGAVAAVIYTHPQEPDAFSFSVLEATLPAVMVSNSDGLAIKGFLAGGQLVTTTVDFRAVQAVDPNRVASFSSRGPNTDLSIKPDLVAIGAALNTATLDGGFATTQGTSFSAPIVSGAAAVLLSARPGFSVHHYRSMLVNGADTLIFADGTRAPIQEVGGGVLNLERALQSTVAAFPTAISFGDTTGPLRLPLTISNLGAETDTYSITAEPFDGGPPPTAEATSFAVPAGLAQTIDLTLSPQGLAPGPYQGYLRIRGTQPGSDIHVPYWYGVRGGDPAFINVVHSDESGRPDGVLRGAFGVRVTDSAGIPILNPAPTVSVVSGGGAVVSVFSSDEISPGLFETTVRLGGAPGNNVFRIQAGSISEEVTIEGQ